MDINFLNACKGKTKETGGLNLPEFRQELSDRYPAYASQIKTMTRPELNELCRQLTSSAPHPISSNTLNVSPRVQNVIVPSIQRPILLPQIHIPSIQNPIVSSIQNPIVSSIQNPVVQQKREDPRIEQLTEFIAQKYHEDEFERGKMLRGQFMHDSTMNYNKFIQVQRDRLERLDNETLQVLMSLMGMINRRGFRNMDMEAMVKFDSSGFFIDSDLKVVIFNAR